MVSVTWWDSASTLRCRTRVSVDPWPYEPRNPGMSIQRKPWFFKHQMKYGGFPNIFPSSNSGRNTMELVFNVGDSLNPGSGIKPLHSCQLCNARLGFLIPVFKCQLWLGHIAMASHGYGSSRGSPQGQEIWCRRIESSRSGRVQP